MPPLFWRRAWTRVSFLKRLSGLTLEPSQADAGVERWICSLRDTRVRARAPQESDCLPKTRATSGRRSDASSSPRASRLSSSKTSMPISPARSRKLGVSFSGLVTTLRQDSLQRRKSATRNFGTDFSRWPSPDAQIFNDGESQASQALRAAHLKAKGINGNGAGVTLAMVAANWPTLTAADSRSTKATNAKAGVTLSEAVETLPTLWPATTTAMVEGGQTSRSGDRKDEVLLNGQAEALSHSLFSPQALETTPAGSMQSKRPERRLSPRFTEWLMGWPEGWSDFDCSETELSLYKLRMRSALCLLVSRPVETPAQQLCLLDLTDG